MEKEIKLNDITIKYDMQYKNVKNINLRIRQDGKIYVSANKYIRQTVIDDFLKSKSKLILKALKSLNNTETMHRNKYFSEDEICNVIIFCCKKIYPYFDKHCVRYPIIKFKKMVSQWGNCYNKRNILTFNINLMYAPFDCIEYVVAHEFTHFIQPNHSSKFYEELSKIMPDWKERRKKLKEISIR